MTSRERRRDTVEILIGIGGTTLLFALFIAWPLFAPVATITTRLHQTLNCAVSGECEALVDRR